MISVLTLYDFHAPQSTECISTRLFLASCIHSHQSMHLYYGIELYLAPHRVIMISLPPVAHRYVFCPHMFSAPVCFLPPYVFLLYLYVFRWFFFFARPSSTIPDSITYDQPQYLRFLCITLYLLCSRSPSRLTSETRLRLRAHIMWCWLNAKRL